MFRSSVSRRVAAFLIVLALAAPLAAAERPRGSSAPLSSLWQWMAAQWSKVGCGVDPDGCAGGVQDPVQQPNASATPNAAEVGCGLDPNGVLCSGHS